jgi:PAS domain S-box-containing protein
MSSPLNVLILEDRESDAELMLRELEKAGYEAAWKRVDSEKAFVNELSPELDVILADYKLPAFEAPRALALLLERGLDVPFIVVTGSVGEEEAVACMRQGAADYLLKDRLVRLGDAVRNAVEQRRLREEKRRAEEALRESEARFRSLYERAPLGYQSLDSEGRIIEVNQSWLDLLGYTREEAMGRWFGEFLTRQDVELFKERFPRFKAVGEVYGVEFEMVRKDGDRIIASIDGRIAYDDRGRFRQTQCILTNITERRNLETQLLQSQKMEAMGRLVGGIAHDFNNLMTAVTGYAELVQSGLPPDAPLRADVEEIRKAGDKASQLVRQLMAFSRKQVLHPMVVDLSGIVEDMAPMLRRIIGEDIQLHTAFPPDLWRVMADPGQMEQVIMNLAVNARDAMPEGGKLTIETRNVELDAQYLNTHLGANAGPHAMLAVSDTGIGMDAPILSRLFEPFFTTKGQGEGTGLGLSTVYGIVKQSGGDIRVYSEPGRGSSFKIYLPRAESLDAVPDEAEIPEKEVGGAETLLIVEDEEVVRRLTAKVLENYGYTVLQASMGDEAVALCQARGGAVDLLVTDLVMPGMGGRELAGRLASICPGMKILYMSGYTENAVLHGGVLEAGVHFLQKPFSPEELARKVRAVLQSA